MSALLELVVHVNNSRWPRVLLYLAARLTTVSFDQITNPFSYELCIPAYDIL